MKMKTRIVVSILALVMFSLLAALVQTGRTAGAESAVYAVLAVRMSPEITGGMRFVTALCDPPAVAAYCLALLLIPRARRTAAAPVVGSAVVAVGLGQLLKRMFLRPRPEFLRLVEETGYSFPSSHSVTSAAVGTALVVLSHGRLQGRRRVLGMALGILYPLLVGVSRVYLGVHHGADVLAGWLLGLAVGLTVPLICERLRVFKNC